MPTWLIKVFFVWAAMIPWTSLSNVVSESTRSISYVPVLEIKGPIGPAVADYVIKETQKANQTRHSELILITLDTPGGLVDSLRDINQAILSSDIPVACLVYPQGARAASAGTFILYACHIAAMAPATTLGAATPVNIGGDSQRKEGGPKEPSAIEKKVMNDSIAYIRSLAQLRGRNAAWAESAVRDAATLSSEEALKKNVVNFIAESPMALIKKLDGVSVTINEAERVLNTDDVKLEQRSPDWRNQFLSTITNPNIAYLLMMVGIYGLILEFYSPGIGFGGIIGGICLLIAVYAFQMLPVSYVGVGLLVLGIGLLVAESLVPSFGLFGIGGLVSFVLGSIFLIDSDLPELQVSLYLIHTFAIASALFAFFVLKRVVELRCQVSVSGTESLIGRYASVECTFEGNGYVTIDGERWAAKGKGVFAQGESVEIERVDNLTLHVKIKEKNND